MQRRTCDHCGADFSARSNRARFCSDACRNRAFRKAPASPPVQIRAVVESAAVAPPADLAGAVRSALSAASRSDTPAGMLAVLLAEQVVDCADVRALPGLSRELSARLGEALAGSKAKRTPVDQLRERRERRGAS